MEYTVKEFSKLAGVTPQAIYKRLDETMTPYVSKRKGVTMIDGDALKYFRNRSSKDITLLQHELSNARIENEVLRERIDTLNHMVTMQARLIAQYEAAQNKKE